MGQNREHQIRRAAFLVFALVTVAACSSASNEAASTLPTTVSESSPAGTDAPEGTDPAVEPNESVPPGESIPPEPSPVDTGSPVSSPPDSSPSDSSPVETSVPAETTSTTMAAVPVTEPDEGSPPQHNIEFPTVTITGDVRDTPVPYFGNQNEIDGAEDGSSEFVVAEPDVPFCAALATMNTLPQPRDDFEELLVGQQYFIAIEPAMPAELTDSFTVILEWVEAAVEAGQFPEDEPDVGDPLIVAVEMINAFVDTRCLGLYSQ